MIWKEANFTKVFHIELFLKGLSQKFIKNKKNVRVKSNNQIDPRSGSVQIQDVLQYFAPIILKGYKRTGLRINFALWHTKTTIIWV